jgi:hypothetical protein
MSGENAVDGVSHGAARRRSGRPGQAEPWIFAGERMQ